MDNVTCPNCGYSTFDRHKIEGCVDNLKQEIAALRFQLAKLKGIRDQFNWQSEQNAAALREREEA